MTRPLETSRSHRVVTGLAGLLFFGIALAIVFVTERTAGPLVAAGVLGVLGLDAVVASVRGKRSLLSRIGPLP